MARQSLLYLCTGNSCRSQMAEGWTRHLHPELYDVYSAGLEAHGLNEWAVWVMAEAGVDISTQRSQHVDRFEQLSWEVVITVCDHAQKNCPFLPAKLCRLHHPFADPPRLAERVSEPEEKLNCYRQVRDEIREFVYNLPDKVAMES